jgi:hypothetical protein
MTFSLKVALRSFGFKPRQRQSQSQTRNLTRRELFAAIRKSPLPSINISPARSEQSDDQRSRRLPSTPSNLRRQGGQHDQQ